MVVDLRKLSNYVLPQYRFIYEYFPESIVILTGGRGSGKTSAIIQMLICDTFKDPNNILILRGTYKSHKKSTFADFLYWIDKFKMNQFFSVSLSPLVITNKLTGGHIYFEGADSPNAANTLKGIIKLKKCFIEEANVGVTQEILRIIKGTMRGIFDMNGIEIQAKMYLSYNPDNPFLCPWKEWVDEPEKYNVKHLHTTYLDNPFNGQDYVDQYELLKKINIKQYRTEALGEYGTFENAILDIEKIKKISKADFDKRAIRKLYNGLGIDFGTSHHQTFSHVSYDEKKNDLYVHFSIGEAGLTNSKFIKKYLKPREQLKNVRNKIADCARPDNIIELNDAKWKFRKSYKNDMELTFIEFFNNLNNCYLIGDCQGFENNVASWIWNKGKPDNKNEDYVDSIRYALEDIIKDKLNKSQYKQFSHNLPI